MKQTLVFLALCLFLSLYSFSQTKPNESRAGKDTMGVKPAKNTIAKKQTIPSPQQTPVDILVKPRTTQVYSFTKTPPRTQPQPLAHATAIAASAKPQPPEAYPANRILKPQAPLPQHPAVPKPAVHAVASTPAIAPASPRSPHVVVFEKTPVKPQAPVANTQTKITAKQPTNLPSKTLAINQLHPQLKPSNTTFVQNNLPAKKSSHGNKDVALRELLQLPYSGKEYNSKASAANHIPYPAKSGLKDGDIVTTKGYLHLIATEDSAMPNEIYYLQLTVRPGWGDSCLIVKIPYSELTTAELKDSADHSKKFIRERLVKGRVPTLGGNIMRKPVYVSVTGQLYYNAHGAAEINVPKPKYRGKKGMNSYTAWEIHPVYHLEFAMP